MYTFHIPGEPGNEAKTFIGDDGNCLYFLLPAINAKVPVIPVVPENNLRTQVVPVVVHERLNVPAVPSTHSDTHSDDNALRTLPAQVSENSNLTGKSASQRARRHTHTYTHMYTHTHTHTPDVLWF